MIFLFDITYILCYYIVISYFNLNLQKGCKQVMAARECSLCCGSGLVDEGTPNERECPQCCGTGYETTDDEDD